MVNCDQFCRMATVGIPCFSFLFLVVSVCLSFASLGQVKLKQYLCVVPQKAREAGYSSCSSFPIKENSF